MIGNSPFTKPLADLEAADLGVLKEVPESWHVEYKLAINDAKTLAKQLGAFANTYGGWLLIGVKESDGPEKKAEEFPGLDGKKLSLLLQRLGSSVNGHLQPVPHYEQKVFVGPCEVIGLPEGRSIVLVHVAMSTHTPHLQRDGRVYHRVGDTSQPQPINERRLLDELWQRGDRVRQATRQWIERDPEFSEGEGERPYLRLMFVPDPWNKKYRLPSMSPGQIQEVLNQPGLSRYRFGFDAVFPTGDGFIARHVVSNNPGTIGLTLSVYRDYSCDIIVPLNVLTGTRENLPKLLGDRYEHGDSYVKMLLDRGYWHADQIFLSVVDMNPLLSVVFAITSQYRALLRLVTPEPVFHFKARVLHGWRKVIFFDVPEVIEGFARYGVPMPMHDEWTIPPGTDPDTFVPVGQVPDKGREADNEIQQGVDQAVVILFRLLSAFGVSGFVNDEGEINRGFEGSLLKAADRVAVGLR